MCDFKMKEIDDLPDDVLLEVQRRLPPSDLKNATLVKRKWKAVGEHPTLWEKFTITVYSKEDITNLSIKRLRLIQEISINPFNWDVEDWKAFFRTVMGLSRLKKIDGLFWDPGDGLKLVEPSLFSKSLAKLEDVAVSGCTGDQIQALFSEMSISTKIKKLELAFCHLSQLEPGLFGKVLSRLEDLILTANGITKDQMEAFLTEILNKSSLKRLVLNEDSLRHMPELFARALSKVEDVRLTDDGNAVPLEALFTELSYGTHQLKRLEVHGGDFTQVVPALVAHVLSRLEELSLHYCRISGDQVQALFTEMSHLPQMKKLHFEDVDLSQLEAELFAKAMVGLEDVDLCLCDTTAQQMVAFFTEVSRNTQMKKINLNFNDLSSVDPQDFARALIRLEEVSLRECNITHDQAIAFFTEMSQNTKLKKLQLTGNLSTVDPEILASAITKVKEVNLWRSTLSTEQIGRIFTCLLESEKELKKLDLSLIDAAAQVDPEIVRKVEDKLKGELKMT